MIRTSSSGCGKKNESDVADKVLAAHFPFKISNLLEYPQFLTPEMSRMPDFIGRDEFLEVK